MWLDTVVDRRAVLCVVDRPPAGPEDLLRQVLTDFGMLSRSDAPPPGVSSGELTDVLQRFLAALRTLDAHAFVVIENAATADEPTRAVIDRLRGLEPGVLEVLLVDTPKIGSVFSGVHRLAGAGVVAVAAVASWLWLARTASTRTMDAPVRDVAAALRLAAEQPAQAPAAAADVKGAAGDVTAAYRVHVGAFRDPARAEAAIARFRQMKLPVEASVMESGLRQVALGPYVLRAEASAALAMARDAGFADAVLVKTPGKRPPKAAEERTLLARAELLAERHDVRALETLRAAWLEGSDDGARQASPTLAAIDQYLDAARRVQLAADRRLLVPEGSRR